MLRANLAAVLLAGLLTAGVGCASPDLYVIDIVTTYPTEADDAPGIHFDAERNTPARPIPKYAQGFRVSLSRVPAGEEGAPVTLVEESYSTTYGCVSFVGKGEFDADDMLRLSAFKKGHRPFTRDISLTQARDASMTIVVEELPTRTGEGGTGTEAGSKKKGAGAGTGSGAGAGTGTGTGTEGGTGAGSKKKGAGAGTGSGAGAGTGTGTGTEGGIAAKAPLPDHAAFDKALDRIRGGLKQAGWTLLGIETREDGTLATPGWPMLRDCRAIRVEAPAVTGHPKAEGRLFVASAERFQSEVLRKARSNDKARAAYLGELQGYQFFLSPEIRARHAELSKTLAFK